MTQGHIRRRGPRWEVRVSAGTDPATGKRRIVTATVPGTRRDAEKELRRRLKALDDGTPITPDKLTFGAWLNKWLALARPEVSPMTHKTYALAAQHYIEPHLGHIPLGKLSPVAIQEFYAKLAEDGARVHGRPGLLAPSTRRQVARILTVALNRAVETEMIARNPAIVLRRRTPKLERREPQVLTPAQSRALLDAARGDPLYPAILIAMATGCRRGEIAALRWSSIDVEKGEVAITSAAIEPRKGEVVIASPKGRKARRITLPATALAELRVWRTEQAEHLLRLGIRQTPDTFVCTRADGVTPSPSMLGTGFRRLAARLGFPVHLHTLRHGHATHLLLAGVHPKVAQERLGHASVSLTLDVYSHVVERLRDDAAEKIDAIISGSR